MSETVEDTGGSHLDQTEDLGIALDTQIIRALGNDRRVIDEPGDDRPGTCQKQHRAECAPQHRDRLDRAHSLTHSVILSGPVVLGRKGIAGTGEAFRHHPGNGFDLNTDLLRGDRRVSESRYLTGQKHGDHREDHRFHTGRQTDTGDRPIHPQGMTVQQADVMKEGNTEEIPRVQSGSQALGDDRAQRRAEDAHAFQRSETEDQQRVKDDIGDQCADIDTERRFGVATGGVDTGRHHIPELEDAEHAGDEKIALRIRDHGSGLQTEEADQLSREKDADQ